MKIVLVTMDKKTEDFVQEAKKDLAEHHEIEVIGKGRDTVLAVDVAELLKLDGFKTGNITTKTEEAEIEGKKIRTSQIIIHVKK
jgi:DNA-binding protein